MIKTARGNVPDNRSVPGLEHWVRRVCLDDGTPVCLRLGTPQDADLYPTFLEHMTAQDMRLRFFGHVKDTGAAFIKTLHAFDRAHAMAFIATHLDTTEMLGVARLHAEPDQDWGEFAVAVRSDFQGRGIGLTLMEMLIDFARDLNFEKIEGQVLAENTGMLAMCDSLGFKRLHETGAPGIVRVALDPRKRAST